MPDDSPLDFEKALNKIKADDKAAPGRIHNEAQQQDVSLAMPDDRRRYLLYCVSLVDFVDGDLMRKLPENVRTIYSGGEMAMMVKVFLSMKIHGAHNQMIAKRTGIPVNVIEDFDFIAQMSVKRAIAKAQKRGIPIVGLS